MYGYKLLPDASLEKHLTEDGKVLFYCRMTLSKAVACGAYCTFAQLAEPQLMIFCGPSLMN